MAMIRKVITMLLFCSLTTPALQAQDLDLIVTLDGDSLACHIDSISDQHIHLRMKSQNKWVHTQMELSQVSEYQQNTVLKGDYVFIPGTSWIESAYDNTLPRNSIYAGILSAYYSRTFGNSPTAFMLGIGFSFVEGPGIVLESNLIFGNRKHYLESGIIGGYYEDYKGILFRIGWRYQGARGLLLRSAPLFGVAEGTFIVLPALSIGYSF